MTHESTEAIYDANAGSWARKASASMRSVPGARATGAWVRSPVDFPAPGGPPVRIAIGDRCDTQTASFCAAAMMRCRSDSGLLIGAKRPRHRSRKSIAAGEICGEPEGSRIWQLAGSASAAVAPGSGTTPETNPARPQSGSRSEACRTAHPITQGR